VFSLTTDSSGTQYEVTTSDITLASLAADINANVGLVSAGITAQIVNSRLAIFYNGASGDIVELYGDDTLFAAAGIIQGDYYAPKVQISTHTNVPAYKTTDTNSRPTGSIWVKTTAPNGGRKFKSKTLEFRDITLGRKTTPMYDNNAAAVYGLDSTGSGVNLAVGELFD